MSTCSPLPYITGYHLKPTCYTMCSHHCSLGMTDGRHRCTSSGIPTYCPSSLLPPHVFPLYTRENRHSQRTDKQPWHHIRELMVVTLCAKMEEEIKSKDGKIHASSFNLVGLLGTSILAQSWTDKMASASASAIIELFPKLIGIVYAGISSLH